MSEKRTVLIIINFKNHALSKLNSTMLSVLDKSVDRPAQPIVTTCNFSSLEIPARQYYCYDLEACCEHGCCTKATKQFYQHWYYWIILIAALLILSTIRYLYNRAKYKRYLLRIERERVSLDRCPVFRHMCHSNYIFSPPTAYGDNMPIIPQNVPRLFNNLNLDSTEDSEVILNQLFASFTNSFNSNTNVSNAEPPNYVNPPDYESLSLKAVIPELPPPKYSDTCIKKQDLQLRIISTIPATTDVEDAGVVIEEIQEDAEIIPSEYTPNDGNSPD